MMGDELDREKNQYEAQSRILPRAAGKNSGEPDFHPRFQLRTGSRNRAGDFKIQRELLSSESTAIIPAYRERWRRAS
jgi:hypothetical protein